MGAPHSDALIYAARAQANGHVGPAAVVASPGRAKAATRHQAEPAAQVLTLPWPPTVNRLTAIYQGRNIKTRESRAYKADAQAAARAAGVVAYAGDVAVELRFYRPRKAGDLDNRLKAVLDALTGLAYGDDAQVRRIEAELYDDKAAPRVEVVVRPHRKGER